MHGGRLLTVLRRASLPLPEGIEFNEPGKICAN